MASSIASAIGEVLYTVFATVFEGVQAIWDYMVTLVTEYLNPFSDNFILWDVLDFLGTLVDYINPFSDNFILSTVISHLANVVSYINPFSDNFFGITLLDWLSDLLTSLFVPDDDYYSNKISELQEQLEEKTSVSQSIDILEEMSDTYEDYYVDDIDIDIDIEGYSLTTTSTVSTDSFIDFSFLTQYKDTWYSWVRVFVYIALIFYNLNELIKLLSGKVFVNGSGKSPEYNVVINDNSLNGNNSNRKLLND